MSMLTPPGMGGKYKVTGNTYPRMRRPRQRRRRFVIATALVSAVCVLTWGTLELIDVFSGTGHASAAQRTKCGSRKASAQGTKGTQAAPALPKPETITVNVYNATPRTGLAKQTADELEKRGFKIGKVGNAPAEHDKKVKETALLLGGPDARAPLTVLGAQISGERSGERPAQSSQSGTNAGATAEEHMDDSVDFLIGTAFTQLAPAAEVGQTLAALQRPAPESGAGKPGRCDQGPARLGIGPQPAVPYSRSPASPSPGTM